MKKNKTQRQLNAYYRNLNLLKNPNLIKLEETRSWRKATQDKKPTIKDILIRLQDQNDILREKLSAAENPPKEQ